VCNGSSFCMLEPSGEVQRIVAVSWERDVAVDKTTAKGLMLLERLAQTGKGVGVSAIATELGLQKSNVHRTFATLTELGFARKDDDTGRYVPTLKLWELGAQIIGRHPVRRAALPFMQALHKATDETVNLTVLDQGEVLYLEKIAAHYPVRATSDPGLRAPAVFPASGKALLAALPDARALIEQIAKSLPRERRIKPAELAAELKTIRKRGYAISLSGWRDGVNSVASVVLDEQRLPVAAIAISGPAERMGVARMESLSEALINACTRISAMLGRG
jgi:IclR family KDG regulon transcriptional repressor